MTKQETEQINKAIKLLSMDGSNTKKQARELLSEMVKK